MHIIPFRARLMGLIAFLLLSAPVSAPALAQNAPETPISEADLGYHIRILSDDSFEGRAPGSAGEVRTIAYISAAWAQAGLEPIAGSATPWLQPVPLVESQSSGGTVQFRVRGRKVDLGQDSVIVSGQGASESLEDLPAIYVGYGVDGAGKVSADVAGKLAIMLKGNVPFGKDPPAYPIRRQMLADAGAKAVLIIPADGEPWVTLRDTVHRKSTRLADAEGPAIGGFLSLEASDALFTKARQTGDALFAAARSAEYRGLDLPMTATLAATATLRAFDSHNVIAKLPGAQPDGKAVVFLGHWDHLGLCLPEGAPDRICNGAVDNASGIAVLIEVAKKLAAGPRPDRDIYFVATTAEERGLLGATYFAAHPVVPLQDIIVALNIDTIAISPRGTPVATIGRGQTRHDAMVQKIAAQLGRKIDEDGEADAFVTRQDGWALGKKGVISLMVGGSFSDMALLEKFLASDYHQPGDAFSAATPLGGAAEDADLHVALARAFASTSQWSTE
jgi:Zn-dependent M28 family amino/carboxypeptidase